MTTHDSELKRIQQTGSDFGTQRDATSFLLPALTSDIIHYLDVRPDETLDEAANRAFGPKALGTKALNHTLNDTD
jgi:hypothetical protein